MIGVDIVDIKRVARAPEANIFSAAFSPSKNLNITKVREGATKLLQAFSAQRKLSSKRWAAV